MTAFDCWVDFTLACARFLPGLPADHPCRRVHGHTFDVRVQLRGPLDAAQGWVADFHDVEVAWQREVHAVLDHRLLNDVPGLENPTSEHVAAWCWSRLSAHVPALARIEVRESGRYGIGYMGP
jgi:6-pyruvoyltetrahydropterin/6-carboxytetrahydropterin synthase